VFCAFLVRFQPSPTIDIAELTGFRMAAALLALVHRYDPSLSALLHDGGAWPRGLKPYTVSAAGWAPSGSGPEINRQRVAEFRITILEGDLLGPVVSALTQCAEAFRPGNRPAPVASLEMDQRRTRWAGWITRGRLWDAAPDCESASLLVASPTAFRATTAACDSFVTQLEPSLLIGSMLPKWEAYVGIPLDKPVMRRLKSRVRTTAARCEQGMCVIRRQTFKGFTGVVDLLAPDRETGKVLNALVALAFYTGLGMKTADGMGQTLPLPAGAAAMILNDGAQVSAQELRERMS